MKTILFALCCFSAISSTAQLPPFQWANKMVGSDSKSMASDAFGNVYIMGNMGPSSTRDVDPGPGINNLYGVDGPKIIYKLNSVGEFIWAKQLPIDVSMECIQADAAGNVYLAGNYVSTNDFDPGPGVFNLTPVSYQNDIFILKLNPAGIFVWAKSQGGIEGEIALSIAISATGTIYTAGYFTGTADFDPGAGKSDLVSGIGTDTYISALDTDGNFLWVKHIAGGSNGAGSITTNELGNIVVAGVFSGTKDFNPGAGIVNLTSSGSVDIYIIKLDGLGNYLWAKAIGGIGIEGNEAVALDSLGNVYVTGSFGFTADFDPGPAIVNFNASGSLDMFVLKLNASGDFIWAKQMIGLLTEVGNAIATDATGNVYTTGFFEGIADFDPGPGVFNLTTKGSRDIFISKLNTDGNFVWAVSFGEVSSEDMGNAISLDPAGNVYTTGNFQGQVDFDPGPGVSILLEQNATEFVLKFGPGSVLPLTLLNFSAKAAVNGNLLKWQTTHEINTKHFEIEWSDNGQRFEKIAQQQAAGNSTVVSHYSYLHTQWVGSQHYYRLKMLDTDERFTYSKQVSIHTVNTLADITLFPNPVIDGVQVSLQALKNETLLLYLHSVDGKLVSSKSFNMIKGINRLSWNLTAVPSGKYFISSGSDQFRVIPIMKQ